MKNKRFLTVVASLLTIGALCSYEVASAANDDDGYAFISCVSDTQVPNSELSETKNDASVLNDVLSLYYYHYHVERFHNSSVDVSDGLPDAALKSFVEAFKNAADKAAEDKPFIAVLEGHMFRAHGELYYPLVDYNGKEGNEKVAACSAKQICEIMRDCKASVKILVVDCCFSGSGDWDVGVLGEEKSDFVTFASSQSYQTSRVWLEKQASLFTYWFAFGLRGFADKDHDGAVSLKELDAYVSKRVRETAKALGCEQNPKTFNVKAGGAFKFKPRPMRLQERLEEFAELIVTDLAVDATNNEEDKKILLCVPEFSTGDRNAKKKTVSPQAGTVPRMHARALESAMKDKTINWAEYPINGVFRRLGELGCDFSWIEPEVVEDAMNENGASIGEFTDHHVRDALKEKSLGEDKTDFLIGRNKKLALVQVNLEDYDAAGVKVSARITFDCAEESGQEYYCRAVYAANDLANMGINADNKSRRRTIPAPIADSDDSPGEQIAMMARGPVIKNPVIKNNESDVEKKKDEYPESVVRNLLVARADSLETQSTDESTENPKDKPTKKHPLEEATAYGISFASRPISSNWKGSEGYEPVETTFKDGEAYVEFDPNVEYAIILENKNEPKTKGDGSTSLKGAVYVRITVDGRDTISHAPPREAGDESQETWRSDWKRVSIREANGWLVLPNTKGVVCGFAKPNSNDQSDGQLRRFQVVDAEKLGEERDVYAENIGLILFQINSAGDVERGASGQNAGTLPGSTEKTNFELINAAVNERNVLGVFSVHYKLKNAD